MTSGWGTVIWGDFGSGKHGGCGENMKIKTHEGFEVYKEGFEAAMQIFEISKGFPIG